MSMLDRAKQFHVKRKRGHKDAHCSREHLKLALLYCEGEITGLAVQHALGLKGSNGSQSVGLILIQAVRQGWLITPREKS